MPTYDTYLDNGTGAGLTVDSAIIAYARGGVKIPVK
jgi:hypothetical protein